MDLFIENFLMLLIMQEILYDMPKTK